MKQVRVAALSVLLLGAIGPVAGAPGADQASPARGAEIFRARGTDWSCQTCHTADPRNPGRHTVTGKRIEPMAPAVNAKRLTDPGKIEKWFRRNCKDVFARECTAQEQADVMAYLRSLKP